MGPMMTVSVVLMGGGSQAGATVPNIPALWLLPLLGFFPLSQALETLSDI